MFGVDLQNFLYLVGNLSTQWLAQMFRDIEKFLFQMKNSGYLHISNTNQHRPIGITKRPTFHLILIFYNVHVLISISKSVWNEETMKSTYKINFYYRMERHPFTSPAPEVTWIASDSCWTLEPKSTFPTTRPSAETRRCTSPSCATTPTSQWCCCTQEQILIWWEIFQSSLLFLWLTNKKTAYSCLYVIAVNTKYDINLYREKKMKSYIFIEMLIMTSAT